MLTVVLLALLIAARAWAAAFTARNSPLVRRAFAWKRFRPGAPIIYRESYDRGTPKYWRVEEVRADGLIVARSALMEQYFLQPDDPNLRKPGLLERLRHGARFPYPA